MSRPTEQLEWALDRLGGWGFESMTTGAGDPDVIIERHERVVFRRRPGDPPVVLQTAVFEGKVRISDVERATASLLEGVGSARAYGCGLITLAPVTG